MMLRKHNGRSIRSFVIGMQLFVTTTVLVVCTAAFVYNESRVFKRLLVRNLESMAKVLGHNLVPSLVFLDPKEAEKILSSLQLEVGIISAQVYDSKGTLFANYGQILALDEHERLITRRQLKDGAQPVGDLVIISSLDALYNEYRKYILIVSLVLAVGIVLTLLLAAYFHHLLSRPIASVLSVVREITNSGDYSLRVSRQASESCPLEIQELSQQFDRMIEQVEHSNLELERRVSERTAELREAQKISLHNAHAAGMAEIATGVLHNIGNIVNSINISAEEIKSVVRQSRLGAVAKASRLVGQAPIPAELPAFLELGMKGLEAEQSRLCTEAEHLIKHILLVKDVIVTQQNYAKGTFLSETLDLCDLVDDILAMQKSGMARHRVIIETAYSSKPKVRGQKVKLAHIILNLIKNSKEAMESVSLSERKIKIEIGNSDVGGAYLRVSDRGEGILPMNLDRIFNHGFTTKVQGHGFGLHFCANAMTEMGGRITAQSPGAGQGSVFTIFFDKLEVERDGVAHG